MSWRSGARWFAAEFLVVVTGVLVALALQSWWEQREHARRERIYLKHLSADLQRTREIIQRANVTLGGSDSAGSRLVRAYHTEGFTARDSLYAWFFRAATYQTPTPITATADALVSTGDLRLLSNDTLRSAVSDYLNATNRIQREQERFVTMMTEAVQEVSPYLNFSEALSAVMTPEQIAERSRRNIFFPLPAENLRRPRFSSSLDEILNNRSVLRGHPNDQCAEAQHAAGQAGAGLRDCRAAAPRRWGARAGQVTLRWRRTPLGVVDWQHMRTTASLSIINSQPLPSWLERFVARRDQGEDHAAHS